MNVKLGHTFVLHTWLPWTHNEWLAYLDGWTFAALGLVRPDARQNQHQSIYQFGISECRKLQAEESISNEETTQ